MTQVERIIDYIKRYGSITPLDALKEFGCMRLASRMCDIKAMGYGVVREFEHSKKPKRRACNICEIQIRGGRKGVII